MMGRAIFGLTLQLMLFDDDEVSGRAITHDQMVDRLIEMCVSYLTQT
jgi:hypothetical protein